MEDWGQVLSGLQGQTKQKLQTLEELLGRLEQGNARLDREQLGDFIDIVSELLADNNFKVAQLSLQVLSCLVKHEADVIKPYGNLIIPLVVERLGDAKQQVRQDACELLLSMFKNFNPSFMLEKLARFWSHRAWKVRHGVLQTMAEVVANNTPGIFATKDQTEHVITMVINLVEDSNEAVREASMDCLQEIYRVLGQTFLDNIVSQNIRPVFFKEIVARLDEIAPTNFVVQESAPPSASPGIPAGAASDNKRFSNNDASAARKGGHKNGGGSADAMEISPIAVASDRDLVAELKDMEVPLSGTSHDWQERIKLMYKLVGLAKGCPPALYDVLTDALKGLKDPLIKQVEDRRSAVSKVACFTLGQLSSVLGLRFHEHLLQFMPVLIKVLPITIQVISDAADECVRTTMINCQTYKVLSTLMLGAMKDKNAKIRGLCCGYVAVAVESWDPSVIVRCSDELEACMKIAAMDASADARAAARRMFAAYQIAAPEACPSFMRKLDGPLLDKLSKQPGADTAPKRACLPKPFLSRQPSNASIASSSGADTDIIVMAPPRPQSAGSVPARPMSATIPQRSNLAPSAAPTDMPPPPDRRPTNGRKSFSGATRVLGVALEQLALESSAVGAGSAASGAPAAVAGTADISRSSKARRSSVNTYGAAGLTASIPQRVLQVTPVPAARPAEAQYTGNPRLMASPDSSGYFTLDQLEPTTSSKPPAPSHRPQTVPAGVGAGGNALKESDLAALGLQPSKPMSVAKIVTAIMAGAKAWNEKVELLTGLIEALRALGSMDLTESGQSLPSGDPSRDLERLAPRFPDLVDDPHWKVCVASLEAMREVLCVNPRCMDAFMDRMLPILFAKLNDQKDSLRAGAGDVLADVATCYSADLLMPGLCKALDTNKQPKAKISVLEFVITHLGPSCPAGLLSSTSIKMWLNKVTPLLNDKNADLKKRAAQAVESVYRNMDGNVVWNYAQHSTGADGLALRKLLAVLTGQTESINVSGMGLAAGGSNGGSSAGAGQGSGSTVGTNSGSHPQRSSTSGAPGSTAAPASSSPAFAQQTAPIRPFPIPAAPEFSTTSGFGGGGMAAGAGGVVANAHPVSVAQYQAADYMSPVKVDPSRLQAIGPILDGPAQSQQQQQQQRHTSDPGAPKDEQRGPSSAFSFPSLAQPMATSSLSAAGAMHPQASIPAVVAPAMSSINAATIDVPRDPAAQMRMLSLLTHRLTSDGASAVDTLSNLIDATGKVAASAWTQCIGPLITALVHNVAKNSHAEVRELAQMLIQYLARNQPQLFRMSAILDAVLPVMLSAMGDKSKEAMLAANHALDAVVSVAPHHRLLDLLSAMLPAHNEFAVDRRLLSDEELEAAGEYTCAVCRAVQRVVHGMPASELATRVPVDLLPGLLATYEHPRADVRKASVFALAEIWHVLGDARFETFKQRLAPAHHTLVAWAYSRIRNAAMNDQPGHFRVVSA